MSLQMHYMVKNTTYVFTTLVGTGIHTGTPSHLSDVAVWDNAAGIADQCLAKADPTMAKYFTDSSGMKQPSLLFTAADGEFQRFFLQDGTTPGNTPSLHVTDIFTLIIALAPTTISTTHATATMNHCVVGQTGLNWGLFLKNDAGTTKALGFSGGVSILHPITNAATSIVVLRGESSNLKLTVINAAGTESSATDVGGVPNLASGGFFEIGFNGSGAGTFYDGYIGEYKLWNTGNADGDLTNQIQYFKDEWLVTGQPFVRRFGGVPHAAGRISSRSW